MMPYLWSVARLQTADRFVSISQAAFAQNEATTLATAGLSIMFCFRVVASVRSVTGACPQPHEWLTPSIPTPDLGPLLDTKPITAALRSNSMAVHDPSMIQLCCA